MDNQGTPEEWLDLLKNYTTQKECIEWWENVCKLTWPTRDGARLLRKKYVLHMAQLAGHDWRIKPISKDLPDWVQKRAKEWKESGSMSPMKMLLDI